jgi:large subunit ribosomal protein L17
MRHRRAGWKLGRNTEHRRALLRNLVTSLIVEERIETTITKAKAMRPHVEKMITLGKRGDVAARRLAGSYLMTRDAVDKLFDTISPRYGDREGGYTRIVHGGFRQGDGGDIAFVRAARQREDAGREAPEAHRTSRQVVGLDQFNVFPCALCGFSSRPSRSKALTYSNSWSAW